MTRKKLKKVFNNSTLADLSVPNNFFVPLPVNTDAEMKAYNDDPTKLPVGHKVTFSFLTSGPGHYVWNCEYPCGDSTYQGFGAVMGQLGYMSGKVIVI